MKTCKVCGGRNNDGRLFCQYCGAANVAGVMRNAHGIPVVASRTIISDRAIKALNDASVSDGLDAREL